MVQIIDVTCTNCRRKFRTVPSVIEHAGAMYCSVCGTLMTISEPQPLEVLRNKPGAA